MFRPEPQIVIYDTEYTSWYGAQERNWSGPGEYKEIVEIGAVKIETDEFNELDSLKIYVKPVKNPLLSDYFINLTGITQEIIDREGLRYEEALTKFKNWCGALKIYSWGEDAVVMKENAALLNIGFPFTTEQFSDIRDVFRENGIETTGFMSSTIPRAFGVEPVYRGHDAINDARSIAQGLQLLKKRIKFD